MSRSDVPHEVEHAVELAEEHRESAADPKDLGQAMVALISSFRLSTSRHGPLPDAKELAEYEKIIPGAAERILALAEMQHSHRLKLEKATVAAQNVQSGRRQVLGFLIAVVGLLSSLGAILAGHAIAGTVLRAVDLVALVSVFVLGKGAQRSDLAAKAKGAARQGAEIERSFEDQSKSGSARAP